MPKKSDDNKTENLADDKPENPINRKSVNQAIDSRAKNFLTDAEMKKFLAAARKGRHSVRDFCCAI